MKGIAVLLIIVLGVTAPLAAVSQMLSPSSTTVVPRDVSSILFVGTPTGLAGVVLGELESQSGLLATEVLELSKLAGLVGQIDASAILVFQSDWLDGKVSEPVLLAFLEAVLPREPRIVAVGGSTSLLFDAIDQVRDVFGEGRNPAYDNPSMAGYRLVSATAPDGASYFGEKIVSDYSTDPATLAKDILSWG